MWAILLERVTAFNYWISTAPFNGRGHITVLANEQTEKIQCVIAMTKAIAHLTTALALRFR